MKHYRDEPNVRLNEESQWLCGRRPARPSRRPPGFESRWRRKRAQHTSADHIRHVVWGLSSGCSVRLGYCLWSAVAI